LNCSTKTHLLPLGIPLIRILLLLYSNGNLVTNTHSHMVLFASFGCSGRTSQLSSAQLVLGVRQSGSHRRSFTGARGPILPLLPDSEVGLPVTRLAVLQAAMMVMPSSASGSMRGSLSAVLPRIGLESAICLSSRKDQAVLGHLPRFSGLLWVIRTSGLYSC
jgi:hypothetical protein